MKSRLQNMIGSEELVNSATGVVNHMISQPEQNGEQGTAYVTLRFGQTGS